MKSEILELTPNFELDLVFHHGGGVLVDIGGSGLLQCDETG
jgi:hypothetical protein